MIKCQGANDDFCIEMLAKKGGQGNFEVCLVAFLSLFFFFFFFFFLSSGQQKEFQFLATLDQLRGVDNSEQV